MIEIFFWDWRKNQQQDRSELELLDLKTESKLQKTPLSQRRRLLSRRRRLRDQQHTNRHARRQQFTIARRISWFFTWNWHIAHEKKIRYFFETLVGFCFDGIFQRISGFFSNLFTRAPMEHLFSKTWQTFPLGQEVWGKQGTKRLICSCLSLSRGKYPPYFD